MNCNAMEKGTVTVRVTDGKIFIRELQSLLPKISLPSTATQTRSGAAMPSKMASGNCFLPCMVKAPPEIVQPRECVGRRLTCTYLDFFFAQMERSLVWSRPFFRTTTAFQTSFPL